MAKRQIRVSADGILLELQVLPVQPITVIFKNGQVFYYKIIKVNDLHLQVTDMRNHPKEIDIKEIDEIIIDI